MKKQYTSYLTPYLQNVSKASGISKVKIRPSMPLKVEQMDTSLCLTGKCMCCLTWQTLLGAVEALHKISQRVSEKNPPEIDQ